VPAKGCTVDCWQQHDSRTVRLSMLSLWQNIEEMPQAEMLWAV